MRPSFDMNSFFRGIADPFAGLAAILKDRRMLALAAAPVAIGIVLYAAAAVLLVKYYPAAFAAAWPEPTSAAWWMVAARWFRSFAYYAVLLFAMFTGVFMFTWISNLFGSPFFDLISERMERNLLGAGPEEVPFMKAVGRNLLLIWLQVRRLVFCCLLLVVALPLTFIPVVGTILSFVLMLFFLFDGYMDYPLARRGMGMRGRSRYYASMWRRAAGFGLVSFLLVAVPLLGLVAVPACVAGATRLFWETRSRIGLE